MSKVELKEFNVAKVELKGSNLIEASAGTGKTYSIAILVLRLIVEKKIDLRKILMVTFTKAAVAELEGRIRNFIRMAYKYVKEDRPCDTLIQDIASDAVKKVGRNEVIKLLKEATLYLDETSIFTIHSFCQKTLTEFAFETGQLFGCDVIDSNADITAKAVNEYWRQHITTLEAEKLKVLMAHGLSKANMESVVSQAMCDKYFVYNRDLNPEETFDEVWNLNKEAEQVYQLFETEFARSSERELEHINQNKNASKAFADISNDPDGFYNMLLKKQDVGYVQKLFPNLLDLAQSCQEKKQEAANSIINIIYYLYGEAIETTHCAIERTKERLCVFTYDDLIHNLHQAVTRKDDRQLCVELQKKYQAVFIDEFQDTDKLQYEIFHTLFGKNSILFYIGDPKQAIYSFRGADIDTYKLASKGVDNSFTMKNNFRSTANLIEAMNHFFSAPANPFCDEQIAYELVEAGKPTVELQKVGGSVTPVTFMKAEKKTDIPGQVATEILELLTTEYFIEKTKGERRRVIPSDIAVLVRSKNEGRAVKKALSYYNIPSVTIDESRVLESEEAQIIFYVLKAILEPDKANINRALLNKFTRFSKENLLVLNDELELENYRKIKEIWLNNGVYGALSLLLKLYRVRTNLLDGDREDGERCVTNLLQIIELLHKTELEHRFSPDELISWLQRVFDGALENGDEFVQRMESDEDAVKIVTIHKSKGLAYNIVLAPYLDLSSTFSANYTFIDFKDPDLDRYCFSLYHSKKEKDLYSLQTEQENRRLIYVAITRAVYKCYIFSTGKGSIHEFMIDAPAHIDSNDEYSHLFEWKSPQIVEEQKYQYQKEEQHGSARSFSGRIDNSWRMLSFSGLNNYHASYLTDSSRINSGYEEFVFSQLAKGGIAGNFLHDIFELADFSQENFRELITSVGKRYPSVFQEEYLDYYNQLVNSVLNASCKGSNDFQIKEIPNHKKLAELEFCFDLKDFSPKKLQKLAKIVSLDVSVDLQGAMTGFIDLFFEHKGKYYILDWKSNFLGNSLEDYTLEKLEVAMTGNNYHLQYLIYTIAAKRYLEMRLPNFDYERDFGGVYYVFLRGCRAGANTGVFYAKPNKEMIEAIDDFF